jgi:molybdenum cofactor biosynthesis enzyme MoaA
VARACSVINQLSIYLRYLYLHKTSTNHFDINIISSNSIYSTWKSQFSSLTQYSTKHSRRNYNRTNNLPDLNYISPYEEIYPEIINSILLTLHTDDYFYLRCWRIPPSRVYYLIAQESLESTIQKP